MCVKTHKMTLLNMRTYIYVDENSRMRFSSQWFLLQTDDHKMYEILEKLLNTQNVRAREKRNC